MRYRRTEQEREGQGLELHDADNTTGPRTWDGRFVYGSGALCAASALTARSTP
jgi:hypothetical protein